MPLYVYSCPECDLEIEERRPIKRADDTLLCPVCGTECARVIVVAVAFNRGASSSAEVCQTCGDIPALKSCGCGGACAGHYN